MMLDRPNFLAHNPASTTQGSRFRLKDRGTWGPPFLAPPCSSKLSRTSTMCSGKKPVAPQDADFILHNGKIVSVDK
jgi:hypothetical protein